MGREGMRERRQAAPVRGSVHAGRLACRMARPTARVLAVQRLLRVEHEGAHAARLADGSATPEVSRQAVRYVGGVTRQKRWLDFLVGRFYRGRVQDLDPELLQILRIGAYDLIVRETAPHAAINEAVETAKALLHRGAASLTNGVLRALDRAARAGTLPQPNTGNRADDLATRYSQPTWAVRRWLDLWEPDDDAGVFGSQQPRRRATRSAARPAPAPCLPSSTGWRRWASRRSQPGGPRASSRWTGFSPSCAAGCWRRASAPCRTRRPAWWFVCSTRSPASPCWTPPRRRAERLSARRWRWGTGGASSPST